MTTTQTLGTWTNGTQTLTASYLEPGYVRLDNSYGESWVVTDAEWLARWDDLRDLGFRRA